MFNPFSEVAETGSVDAELVEQAKNGAALEKLVLRHQAWIYNIAGRKTPIGAEVLEMTADNFRKCLARARRDLHSFMYPQCTRISSTADRRFPCAGRRSLLFRS